MNQASSTKTNHAQSLLTFIVTLALCLLLAGCNVYISTPSTTSPGGSGIGSSSGTGSNSCQSNCIVGSGAHGVRVFVEPDAGEQPIVNAIDSAQKSVWVEMYLLSDRNV